jgi:TonB family protein
MSRRIPISALAVAVVVCGSPTMSVRAAETAAATPQEDAVAGTPAATDSTTRIPVKTPLLIRDYPDLTKFYPRGSLKRGQTVKVRVRVCYQANGEITEATLADSSGIKKVDSAALKAAREYKLRPGTLDGVPQAGCNVFPMSFSNDPDFGMQGSQVR